jgi:hypothetical protein
MVWAGTQPALSKEMKKMADVGGRDRRGAK